VGAARCGGVGLGYMLSPRYTNPLEGGVSTAEAWRRKIKAKAKIPLLSRLPRILLTAGLCSTVIEYALALNEGHGLRGSALQTRMGLAGIYVWVAALDLLDAGTECGRGVAIAVAGRLESCAWSGGRADGLANLVRDKIAAPSGS
jgi:hypothetical protein